MNLKSLQANIEEAAKELEKARLNADTEADLDAIEALQYDIWTALEKVTFAADREILAEGKVIFDAVNRLYIVKGYAIAEGSFIEVMRGNKWHLAEVVTMDSYNDLYTLIPGELPEEAEPMEGQLVRVKASSRILNTEKPGALDRVAWKGQHYYICERGLSDEAC